MMGMMGIGGDLMRVMCCCDCDCVDYVMKNDVNCYYDVMMKKKMMMMMDSDSQDVIISTQALMISFSSIRTVI